MREKVEVGRKVIPEKEEVLYTDKWYCDSCGAKVEIPDVHRKEDWDTPYCVLKKVNGYSCSNGGEKKSEYFNVCPKCWDEKIVPMFINEPQKDEVYW